MGDENSSIITSYDDFDKAHEYASAGTYDCVITGVCEYFGFDYAGDRTLLKRLDGLTGDVGLKIANFSGCSNLDYIDSTMNLWSGITDFGLCFLGCSSLPSIPIGLFDNNPLVTTFYQCFRSCSSLTSIPTGLFDNNPLVTTFSNCFYECTSLTLIPTGLFDNNTIATNFKYCFYYCTSITALPDNLILYNVEIDDCQGMFITCSNITSGDGTAFVDRAVAHGVTIYVNCFTNVTNIPDYNLIPADWGGGGA